MKVQRKYSILLFALAYLSFVSLGLPDGLNGVAWPSIRGYFNLPLDALGSLLVMFTNGYLYQDVRQTSVYRTVSEELNA